MIEIYKVDNWFQFIVHLNHLWFDWGQLYVRNIIYKGAAQLSFENWSLVFEMFAWTNNFLAMLANYKWHKLVKKCAASRVEIECRIHWTRSDNSWLTIKTPGWLLQEQVFFFLLLIENNDKSWTQFCGACFRAWSFPQLIVDFLDHFHD